MKLLVLMEAHSEFGDGLFHRYVLQCGCYLMIFDALAITTRQNMLNDFSAISTLFFLMFVKF